MADEKIMFVVSVNGKAICAFEHKKDAIKWCCELWSTGVAYRIDEVEFHSRG